MRRIAAILTFAALTAAYPMTARADSLSLPGDRFALSLDSGMLYVSQGKVDAIWAKPFVLEFGWAWSAKRRPWLNRIEFRAALGLEIAKFAYHDGSPGASGIVKMSMWTSPYATGGGRVTLTVFDWRKWHLEIFGEGVFSLGRVGADVSGMTVTVDGYSLNATDIARQHSEPNFSWRTFSAGATLARSFRAGRLRLTPFISGGVVTFRCAIAFKPDSELDAQLKVLKVDPSVLQLFILDQVQPYGTAGLRLDISRRWSLEASGIGTRISGATVGFARAGATFRF